MRVYLVSYYETGPLPERQEPMSEDEGRDAFGRDVWADIVGGEHPHVVADEMEPDAAAEWRTLGDVVE